tara:strand:+ start:531 stop:638 length:108 start_codon:yes stop_codon:yes gene_type:complete
MGKKEILKELIRLKSEPLTPEIKIKIQKLQQKLDK